MTMNALASVLIKHRAPVLASYLSTPLAHVVVQLIAHQYILGNELDINIIVNAIEANPIRVRVMEYDHKQWLTWRFDNMLDDWRGSLWMKGGAAIIFVVAVGCYVASIMFHG